MNGESRISMDLRVQLLDERATRGFSLVELLVTTLILALTSVMMATGVPVALDTYQRTVRTANAQMALSTTLSALRSEIGLSTEVAVMGQKVFYYDTELGRYASIENAEEDDDENHGLMRQYYIGMPTKSKPVETLQTDGDPEPLITNLTVPIDYRNRSVPQQLRVEIHFADTQSKPQYEVQFALRVIEEGTDAVLASVGDFSSGSGYRVLIPFVDKD